MFIQPKWESKHRFVGVINELAATLNRHSKMDNKEPEDKLNDLYKLIGLVVGLWIISWLVTDFIISCSPETRGQFGDKFGFVNSLFSGLALAGIIYSIILQKRELALQRLELKETRQEFKQQNFETTFFNLLKNQQEIANTIKTSITSLKNLTRADTVEVRGREFFVYCKRELKRIYEALKFKKFALYDYEYYQSFPDEEIPPWDEEELLNDAKIEYTNTYYGITKLKWEEAKEIEPINLGRISYGFFFNRYHFIIGHYFRHLYHILKFLEQSEKDELVDCKSQSETDSVNEKYLTYAQFVQSQMAAPELLLLFYNCLSYPKLLRLVVKYNILENLAKEDLIDQSHNVVDGVNLKSRTNLIN